MGGCRCSFRKCSSRSDGKIHMFHFPVFDKVRCHQWLTNAHKLEFLNLKVSQLKNRVVCQHHFKDENFMNYKKDKLTFDAVPTEDGPNCTGQIDKIKSEPNETKVFSISLDDIENEYLTIVDKKANFSVKYGDFLTNCDLMDLDSLNLLNQSSDNNQTPTKRLSEHDSIPNLPKKQVDFKSSVKTLRPLTRSNRGKHIGSSSRSILKKSTCAKDKIIDDNSPIDQNKTIDTCKESKTMQLELQNSINLKVFEIPVEFHEVKTNEQIPLNIGEPIKVDETKQLSENNQLTMDQSMDVKVMNTSKESQDKSNRSLIKEKKNIGIISTKKILEPVHIVGKFEPISPTRILTIPKKKKINNPQTEEKISDENSPITDTIIIEMDSFNDNRPLVQTESETVNIINHKNYNDYPHTVRSDVVSKTQNETLPNFIVSEKTVTAPNKVSPNISTQKKKCNYINNGTNKILSNTSLLKNKIPPERMAEIAEKRKFNMKLRDIIENCLEKLDEPEKTENSKRKLVHTAEHNDSKRHLVGSYLAKDPELPSMQDYTIAYLEARMKKMENNLLNKIEGNSQKIVELKETYAPSRNKKSVHTQTLVSEDVHKKQLYQELSKYLSREANSLIYEELFIDKYTRDVPKCSSSPKRRKRR